MTNLSAASAQAGTEGTLSWECLSFAVRHSLFAIRYFFSVGMKRVSPRRMKPLANGPE